MAKQQTNLRYIFKIHSSRLRQNRWNLNLTVKEAIDNKELVSLADSTTLRFINEGKNIDDTINNITQQIKALKKLPTSKENKDAIKSLYIKKYNTLFIKDYVCIIIDKEKDFDRMNDETHFFINGIKFRRLTATTGGVKKSTVIYVNEEIYDKLHTRIENNRNQSKAFIPAKLEAYKSLTCSASIPVSDPKGVLVVKDCETEFLSDVILLDDTQTDYPRLEYKENYPIKFMENDGYGLICPKLSEEWANELGEDYLPSGFCIRNSFCKGMLFSFDFKFFAKKIAKSYIVKDAWGDKRDIRNVQVVLTTSMLKLWDSYDSLEHYMQCCKDNGYTFSVTKMTPKKLENERNLNYQFIQSYELSDEDIDELVKPTVQEIMDVLGSDPIKSILFLKGSHLSEDDDIIQDADFITSLMVDHRMIDDPFVKTRIYNMIKKRITKAKMGVLKVKGNFSIISGDPYSLCQSMFGMTVTGLLKSGQFYSKYWNDKNVNKVVAFRAPMTCHNNIRVLRFVNNRRLRYWYRYMGEVTILNSWDTTSHALNGADRDSDAILTTNNPVLLRNTNELPAVLCVQKQAEKIIVTEESLIQSNKDGFGDEIGSTTNKITGMIDVAAEFENDSEEYKELQYRIICGQNYQQNAIDKMKGILCKPMPKEWYDYFSAKNSKNKEFNLKILADKKPYFFIYNYPYEMKRYNRYIENSNKNCIMKFNITLEELINLKDRNEAQNEFLHYYYKRMPVFISKSTMNRICWNVEEQLNKVNININYEPFNYKILMSNSGYTKQRFNAIKKLYEQYSVDIKHHSQSSSTKKVSKEEKQLQRQIFKEDFRRKAYELCSNSEELCNIVVELCYNKNSSKQFAWDICGDIIIKNLLAKNNNIILYPIPDINGHIEFAGEKFSLCIKKIDSEVEDEIIIE